MEKVYLGQPFALDQPRRSSTYVIPLHGRSGDGVGFIIVDRYALNMRVTMRKAYSRSRRQQDFPAKEMGMWMGPSLKHMGRAFYWNVQTKGMNEERMKGDNNDAG